MPRCLRLLSLMFVLLVSISPALARADDGIFPPAPAAKPFIDFDGQGFLINGKRTFIVSGSLHYSRVPRALWRDRLLRIKRAGFNTVQTYAFWNFHEPQEGRWNFSGDHDLDAFLKLVKELDMYAVVRVGPYVCAEWDSGGYPVWLRFKPGVRVREDNPQFEAAVDAWFDKVIPIVAANQIHRGGAVIMVQLENEHPQGWGRDMPNGYFKHLRDKAVALGVEVPYFFSGLHHGSDPAGDNPWDSKNRANPWYTTEFWPGWYNLYGPLDAGRLRFFDRGVWKIIAYGGNGYNFYMLHGGTDFDTWNDDEVASSYDYGGAIGQAGDLRPIYYRFKRAALFARSFADILEDSENATDRYQGIAVDKAIRITARKSSAGTLLCLDNSGDKVVSTQIDLAQEGSSPSNALLILPGEIRNVLMDYKLLPEVTLDLATARVLGITRQGSTTTLVVYGLPDDLLKLLPMNPSTASDSATGAVDDSRLVFSVNGSIAVSKGGGDLTVNGSKVALTPHFPAKGVEERAFTVGDHTVRVLEVGALTADLTWFIEAGGTNYVVIGPEYVGEADMKNGQLRLITERPYASAIADQAGAAVAYGPDLEPMALQTTPESHPVDAPELVPVLSSWRLRPGDSQADVGYSTNGWKRSSDPLPMGADGDTSAYAWYRTTLFAAQAGAHTLHFSDVGDWVAVWVNGKQAGASTPRQRFDRPISYRVVVPLRKGPNTLAVLAAHYGRHKLFSYLGPIDRIDAKGIAGPVALSPHAETDVDIVNWRWRASTGGESEATQVTTAGINSSTGWKETTAGPDVFGGRRGFVWYRATLPKTPGPHRVLHFENVDDNGTIWLNGKRLLKHTGWGEPFDVTLDSAWNPAGPNELAVLVENTSGPGGIMGTVTLQSLSPGEQVRGWRMQGGIGDPMGRESEWRNYDGLSSTHMPTFYRSDFDATLPSETGNHRILRVSLQGMSRGFVWLNGHNLGRYPERVPVDGIYLPECWLKAGKNTLVIFDEAGHAPALVKLVIETASSRFVTEQVAQQNKG